MMNRITYRSSSLPRQTVLLSLFLYFIMRAIIMAQIVIYKLEGYDVNIPLTILLYLVIFAVLIFLLRTPKYWYSMYTKEKVTYYNRLLRKETTFHFADAKLAVFDTMGVKFFAEQDADPKNDKPLFMIPFFRGGIVEAVPIDRFFRMLKERDDLLVVKTFKVLPGYTHKWKFLSVFMAFITAAIIMNCATPLTVIIVLFQAH